MSFLVRIFFFISTLILIIDLITFRSFQRFYQGNNELLNKIMTVSYWLIPLIIISYAGYMAFGNYDTKSAMINNKHYFVMSMLVIFYLPKLNFSAFVILDQLVNSVIWIINKLSQANLTLAKPDFILKIGLAIAGFLFVAAVYGIGWGKFNYKTEHVKLEIENLPKELEGIRIVQFSDFHIGSFWKHEKQVEKAVTYINKLNPDILVFTGDLVNNFSDEVVRFLPMLEKLKAKYGKYSVLGNHDYSEYFPWKNEEEKHNDTQKLIDYQNDIGLKMLLNSHNMIDIGGKKLIIAGVENWGVPPFPQFGDVKKAIPDSIEADFTVLLSHDPSHWKAEVVNHKHIDLVLSGHTHGMQMGILTPWFKWSPVQYKYKEWFGLYEQDGQYLYVNRGIGFIGLSGRIGMPPEVTVIELKRK